jgi:hypothetical protein
MQSPTSIIRWCDRRNAAWLATIPPEERHPGLAEDPRVVGPTPAELAEVFRLQVEYLRANPVDD